MFQDVFRIFAPHIAMIAQKHAMANVAPAKVAQMNAVLDKHGIEGDVSHAPTLGHVASTARALRNQVNPGAILAGEELLAMIDAFNREEE